MGPLSRSGKKSNASRRRCSVVERQGDAVPGAGPSFGLKNSLPSMFIGTSSKRALPSEVGPGSADFESESAVAQVAVHRRVGYRRIGQARLHAILDLVEFQSVQQRKLEMEVELGSSGDTGGIDPDIMGVAQRFGIDDLENVLDRPGQRQIDREPFDRRAEVGNVAASRR